MRKTRNPPGKWATVDEFIESASGSYEWQKTRMPQVISRWIPDYSGMTKKHSIILSGWAPAKSFDFLEHAELCPLRMTIHRPAFSG